MVDKKEINELKLKYSLYNNYLKNQLKIIKSSYDDNEKDITIVNNQSHNIKENSTVENLTSNLNINSGSTLTNNIDHYNKLFSEKDDEIRKNELLKLSLKTIEAMTGKDVTIINALESAGNMEDFLKVCNFLMLKYDDIKSKIQLENLGLVEKIVLLSNYINENKS